MGPGRPCPPPPYSNFQTKQGPPLSVSVSDIRDFPFYWYSEITGTTNLTIFTVDMLNFLDNLRWLLIFSNCIRKIDHFTLDLLKSFSLWTILKKTTMNEGLNVRLKVGILDLLKKSSKTREVSIQVVYN